MNLLIIEDRQEDVALVVNELRRAGIAPLWERVDCEPDFVARLERPDLPDVILANDALPRCGAMRALELLKERKLDIPLIVMADAVDEEAASDRIQRGAADYFVKDRLGRVAAAIDRALEVKRLRGDKQRAEERLEESERQLHLALEAARMITWTWDMRTGKRSSSPPDSTTIWPPGKAPPDLDTFFRSIHPDDCQPLFDRVQQTLKDGSGYSVEFRIPLPTGGVRWVRGQGRVFRDAAGQPTHLAGVSMDITDQKLAERALRESEAKWRSDQEKVQQHLAKLAHVTRLQMMGELMSEVSHEINQPLYAISNFAEASLNRLRSPIEGAGPEILSWLEQIAVQANRAGEIIRRIGRFVRKSPAKLAPADVNRIVRDVVGLLSVDVRLDTVELELQLAESLPPVKVDRIQIEQVLVNLLRNALEAMADNPAARRHLSVHTESLPSGAVRIAVRDNGRGLESGELDRLFEPFFTTKTDGMGMGLSISHSIVEAHGGRLEAVPNPERGMTFQFTLPVASNEAPDDI
ncbi:MAG TPA: ATP-binding protein [Pirellulales bacterium]|nr:ATP-binding protein [Pirellulales bacterium]